MVGEDQDEIAMLGLVYGLKGSRGEARKRLEKLRRRAERSYVSPVSVALVHVGMGEKDRALDSLEKAYERRDPWMTLLKVFPRLDPLRSDPRFQDLLRRMNFPP